MHQPENCIFCQIVKGSAPAIKLHEDELTMTFLDIFPAAPGHLLIITKEHFSNLMAADPEAVARVAANSVAVAKALEATLSPDGIGVYQLNGAAAGQTVFHYHMHLIPRKEGEGRSIHAKAAADAQQLEALAEVLRPAIETQFSAVR